MREAKVESYFKARVREEGGAVRKVKFLDTNGAPDRIMMIPPSRRQQRDVTLVWVELKAPGEPPELHQKMEHAALRSFDQRVEVIDTLEGVDRVIAKYFTSDESAEPPRNHSSRLFAPGYKFGSWTLLSYTPAKRGPDGNFIRRASWECQCECGVVKTMRVNNLRDANKGCPH